MDRTLYSDEHEMFRQSFRQFLEREVVPQQARWNEAGIVDRAAWRKAGAGGFLCPWLEEEHGGPGGDFLHSVVIMEEMARVYESGFALSLHSDIVVPYIHAFGNEEQKRRWLPGCASGELVTAHRHDRAGHGLRPGRRHHLGRARRRRLRPQRGQDVHLERHPVRPVHRRGQDRSESGQRAPRHEPVRRRGGHARVHQGQEAGQDGHAVAGHLGARLRGLPRAGGQPAGRGGQRASSR